MFYFVVLQEYGKQQLISDTMLAHDHLSSEVVTLKPSLPKIRFQFRFRLIST